LVSKLVYHPLAEEEAMAAFDWYFSRSPAAARAFNLHLERAEEQATSYPTRWSAYFHGTRRFSMKRYPYALVYLQRDDEIYVVAVAHLRRRPGYWKNRLP
jgi:plasmid stabilization system protein ParE